MKKINIIVLFVCTSIICFGAQPDKTSGPKNTRPNVLMIVVDDLRPELNCYGQSQIISPNIDKLANNGIVFMNSFCNVPVCGASRASLMSSVRPTEKRFVNANTHLDKDLPGHLSLARYLKQNGYSTVSIGKVYHNENDDLEGWSIKPMPLEDGKKYINPETLAGKVPSKKFGKVGPAFEIGNTEDDAAYRNGEIAYKALEKLDSLKETGTPFFLAVGFVKPHLPFCAPKKYFDLYNRDEIKLPDNYFFPKDAPENAFMNSSELRSMYSGVPKDKKLPEEYGISLKHAYFASVSYTDAMIGKVINKLKEEGLEDNTIIVLWGDHGWNLGEHLIWGKHNNFEKALRAPLIVSAHGYPHNLKSKSLVEFVDVYPSIVDLIGLPIPDHCQGKSFVPVLKDPNATIKDEVFCRWKPSESVHTMKYAYTEWRDTKTGELNARMLYDLETDPEENVNVAEDPKYKDVIDELMKKIQKNMATR